MRYLVILIWWLVVAMGCQTASQQSQTDNSTPMSSLVPPDQPNCPDQSALLLDQLDTLRAQMAGTFPYVYQGAGRSNILEAYAMRFVLCYDELLQPLTNDQVNWIKPDQYSEQNGNFITYIRKGRNVSLGSPYISVQYIAKSLPGCSTIDSMFIFWDNYYLKPGNPNNKVTMEVQPVRTLSGRVAQCKEYQTQPNNLKVVPKRIAYAYIDYGPDYFIGLALTTSAPNDWDLNRPLFYKLVRSFSFI